MKKPLVLIFSLVLLFFAAKATNTHFSTTPATTTIADDEGIKVKLTLAGKTYDLVSYTLNYTAVDKSRLDAMPVNALNNINVLSVTIKSSKIDQELIDWILSPDSFGKDGQIVITDGESGKTLKTLTFSFLKPNSYTENYFSNNGNANGTILRATTAFSMHFGKVSIKQ